MKTAQRIKKIEENTAELTAILKETLDIIKALLENQVNKERSILSLQEQLVYHEESDVDIESSSDNSVESDMIVQVDKKDCDVIDSKFGVIYHYGLPFAINGCEVFCEDSLNGNSIGVYENLNYIEKHKIQHSIQYDEHHLFINLSKEFDFWSIDVLMSECAHLPPYSRYNHNYYLIPFNINLNDVLLESYNSAEDFEGYVIGCRKAGKFNSKYYLHQKNRIDKTKGDFFIINSQTINVENKWL